MRKGEEFTRTTIKNTWRENKDGGLGRHTEPPLTTRTHRKSKGKEVRHQVHKKETYIQTPVGEDSRCRGGTETDGVWDERGRQSDHWQTLRPLIHAQINREGPTQSGGERGRQSGG